MGFISKTIFVTTGVPGITSSVKQKQLRAQRAQLAELRTQTKLMREIADPGAAEREQAVIAARHAARVAQANDRRIERDARVAGRAELRAARGPIVMPAWLRTALRALGWLLVAFFALAALGGAMSASLIGMLACAVLAAGTALLMRRTGVRRGSTTT